MKEAWKQYKVIPKVTIPKENDERPIDYNGNKGKGNPIEYDGIIPHEDLTPKPQPKPIAPIPENDKDQQYFKFFYYGTEMKVRYNPSLAVKLANANGNTLILNTGAEFTHASDANGLYYFSIYGGKVDNASSNANYNTVIVNGGEYTIGDLAGGYGRTASYNTVTILRRNWIRTKLKNFQLPKQSSELYKEKILNHL